MQSKETFIKLIDKKFFTHLISKSLIPFDIEQPRAEYLEGVYTSLLSNILNYKPKQPRKYISTPKNKYVIRMIPTFELNDYCIYYFCLKILEEYIAENRTPGTFGGFRLGGKLREQENHEFEPAYEDSYNENSFNAFAWKQEYGEYQAKLHETALEMGHKYQFAVHIDIANFYDCIRLDILETKIKKRVNNSACDDEIHLLFRFLKYWNEKYDSEKKVGIPQDENGDCSRILANFFLQDYDQFIYKACKKKDASYIRYADDQIIFTQSKQDADELLYQASHKLFEEGLNINTGKLKEFTSFKEFDDCFGFSVFEKLKFDSQDVNQAFDLFIEKKESSSTFRESSVLKRLLHNKINLNNLHNSKRMKLLSYLWDENFLLFANDHYMNQIFKMLRDKDEKAEFIETLKKLSSKTSFEAYKIHWKIFEKNFLSQ